MEMVSKPTTIEPQPSSPDQLRRKDAAENRSRILDVARELFLEHGVDDVSMHQIGLAAGIGQGTLYRNFEHKGELCAALVTESSTSVRADIERVVIADNQGVLEQIDYVLRRLATWSEESAPLIAAMVEACCGNRRTDLYRLPLYCYMQQTVATLLRRAIATAEIAELDVEYTADAILALLDINLSLYQRQELGFDRERIVAGMRHLVFHGLAGGDIADICETAVGGFGSESSD
jgi:AcrR family transcriptional regulator